MLWGQYIIGITSQTSGAKSGGGLRSKRGSHFTASVCNIWNCQHTAADRNIKVDESPDYEVVEGLHGEQENDSDVYENITQL